jgi:H+-translocating NAD(P) transhydrogenase subunit alpha
MRDRFRSALCCGWLGADVLLVFFCLWLAMRPAQAAAAESPVPAAAASEGHQPQADETASEQSKDMLLLVASIYILVLAGFVGFEVIGRVSPLLHTPLMSATNAISGISLVGSLIAAGNAHLGTLCNLLGFIAVTTATINVVGGFMITDRMLKMFKLKRSEHP